MSDKQLYRMKADILKSLAHPIRLQILDCLGGGEQCVCKISERLDAERSNVSRHLAVMVKSGVLTSRKEGLMVYYRLRTPCVLNFSTCVARALREQLRQSAELLTKL